MDKLNLSELTALKLLYFDANSIVKYFIKKGEKGCKTVRNIIDERVKLHCLIFTSKISINEVPKVLKKKLNLPPSNPQKISEDQYKFTLGYFRRWGTKLFRVAEEVFYMTKPRHKYISYREILNKYNLKPQSSDTGDARYIEGLVNFLYRFCNGSHPIAVTSDRRLKKIIRQEGYRYFDPEKKTIYDLKVLIKEAKRKVKEMIEEGD